MFLPYVPPGGLPILPGGDGGPGAVILEYYNAAA